MPVEPMHRAILAADIEGFGRLERSNPVRARLRAALHHLLDHSLTHASIDPWRREHTDHGDCVLVLLDPHTPKNRLLHPLVPKLAAALAPRSACACGSSSPLARSSGTPTATAARTSTPPSGCWTRSRCTPASPTPPATSR